MFCFDKDRQKMVSSLTPSKTFDLGASIKSSYERSSTQLFKINMTCLIDYLTLTQPNQFGDLYWMIHHVGTLHMSRA